MQHRTLARTAPHTSCGCARAAPPSHTTPKPPPQAAPLRRLRPRLRLLLLLLALPCPASAQYCDPGAIQAACDTALVVCADLASNCANVQSTLNSTAAFSLVDTFDAVSGTPNVLQLAAYHAVLVYGNFPDYGFADPVLLGDRLAAFHDQGGGVVVANYANDNGMLLGAYGTPDSGYALLNYSQGDYIGPLDSLGEVLEPLSPLMAGVAFLNATAAWRSMAPIIAGRAVVVARWGNGDPLVLRGKRGARTLVELNFFPPSSSAKSSYWTGDGALLLRNGLKYSRCAGAGGAVLSLSLPPPSLPYLERYMPCTMLVNLRGSRWWWWWGAESICRFLPP